MCFVVLHLLIFQHCVFLFVYFNQTEQLSPHHSLNPSCNSWNCGISEPCSTAWWKCAVRAHIQSSQTWMLFISVMSSWLWISPSLSSTCCAQQTGEVSASWVLVSSCQSLWHRSASCRPSARPSCTTGSPYSAWAGYDMVEMLFKDLVELLILIPLDKCYKNKCSLSAYWQWYLIKSGVSHRFYILSLFSLDKNNRGRFSFISEWQMWSRCLSCWLDSLECAICTHSSETLQKWCKAIYSAVHGPTTRNSRLVKTQNYK